jgi:hypothetical protein
MGLNRLVPPMLEGYPVAWFAPRYKYLAEIWRDFRRTLLPITRHKDESARRIELVTGGSIEFWSLEDEDAGRSRRYKRVVVDEAAKVRKLEDAWQQGIRPTLTDFRGEADFLSTPKGRNFFWKAFVWGQSPDEPEWATWSSGPNLGLPTALNPYIDPAEIAAAKRGLPERVFRQEYLAEFLEEAGGVFRGVAASIDRGRVAPDPPAKNRTYTTGMDIARVEDFTVLCVLDQFGRQVYFERFNQVSWERVIAAAIEIQRKYPGELVIDSTGVGDPIFERLVRTAGLHVHAYQFTNASKTTLIDNLALGIERGKYRLMDIPEQEAELVAFEYELTPSRNVRMSAPEGMHDDCVIALALAAWGAANPQRMTFR